MRTCRGSLAGSIADNTHSQPNLKNLPPLHLGKQWCGHPFWSWWCGGRPGVQLLPQQQYLKVTHEHHWRFSTYSWGYSSWDEEHEATVFYFIISRKTVECESINMFLSTTNLLKMFFEWVPWPCDHTGSFTVWHWSTLKRTNCNQPNVDV